MRKVDMLGKVLVLFILVLVCSSIPVVSCYVTQVNVINFVNTFMYKPITLASDIRS